VGFVRLLIAIALALRLLSPAGFMPAFNHGSVTIVACPDYEQAPPPMAHHRQGGAKGDHQPCPYAAGAAAGTLADILLFAAALLFAATLPLGRTFDFLEKHRTRERPPLRGPPPTA
jgi:hypothetical protein